MVPFFLKAFKKQSQAEGRDQKGEIEGSPEQHRKRLRVSIWSQKILGSKELCHLLTNVPWTSAHNHCNPQSSDSAHL